jgi:hypothetical protein
LILLALGTGLGLTSVSPWANTGASASTIGKAASYGSFLPRSLLRQWLDTLLVTYNACDSRWFGHSSMINAMRGSEVAQFPGERDLSCCWWGSPLC